MLDKNSLKLHETIVQEADPLMLTLKDEEFIDVIDQSIADSKSYYTQKNLYNRQDKNLAYYLGKQFDPVKQPTYQTPYVENVVYEAIRRIKPIASSRLPDLTVKPGNLTPDAKKNAELLTSVFNTDIKKRENRKLLGTAHVHEQLFFFACIKARWNTELGTDGDAEFLNVYPKNIVWDHTCKTSNADDMRFIAETAEITLKEILMMFPKKADEFLEYLGILEENGVDKSQKHLASTYAITEVWFHWYKESEDKKWEKINAVVWKYGTFVLGKMRNPYFDYEGKVHLFTKEMKEKGLPSEEELKEMLFGTEEEVSQETIYYNYFKNPRKPYFFMVYESLGNDPIDETNRVEQILYFQDHINQEGSQIIGMNERSAGKLLVNAEAIDKPTLKSIDWHNYNQALSVNGEDIGKALTVFAPSAAPAQLYNSKSENRSIAFEMLGVNATTRGVREGDQTLGEAQMFREADYGFIDDLVEETINDAAEWIAQWKMQFIRVFYTKKHLVDAIGKDGESLYASISQDMVEDGMIAEVSASGVDKMLRKRLAMENAKLGMSDPLSFFEDTEQSNPKERAYRAFIFKAAPMQYYQEFLAPTNVQPGVPGLIQLPADQPPMPGQEQGMPVEQGIPPQAQPPLPPPTTQSPQVPMGGGSGMNSDDPLGLFV